jgi:CNT family concentrative nucleoside transporter
MAEMRDPHTVPSQGVAHNDDPALDIAREHHHQHVHHSAHGAHPDNIVYTSGTTDEKTSKFFQPSPLDHGNQNLHQRHSVNEKHDIEKAGGYDYEVEKATRSSSDPELEAEKKPWYTSFGAFYRAFRLPIHIFIGALFTG